MSSHGSSIVTACDKKSDTVETTVDKESIKNELASMMDRYHQTMKAKDATGMVSMVSEDGMICGTDPSELWNKETFVAYVTKAFADTTMKINDYTIDQREIRVAEDGETALILEQFKLNALSQRVPARMVSHVVKNNDNNTWQIDFSTLSMVPTNEDLGKLDKALAGVK